MIDLHKHILAKFNKTRLCRGEPANPFKDVKIIHEEQEDYETLIVQLDTTEELNIDALEQLISELISADMIKNNLINITTHRSGNSDDIRYEGSITIKHSPEPLLESE